MIDEDRLVRESERRRLTGISRTQWWRLERQGAVPRRRQLGANSVGWSLQELLGWVNSRPVVVGAAERPSHAPAEHTGPPPGVAPEHAPLGHNQPPDKTDKVGGPTP